MSQLDYDVLISQISAAISKRRMVTLEFQPYWAMHRMNKPQPLVTSAFLFNNVHFNQSFIKTAEVSSNYSSMAFPLVICQHSLVGFQAQLFTPKQLYVN